MAEAFADLWLLTYLHPITMGVFYVIFLLFIAVAFVVMRR